MSVRNASEILHASIKQSFILDLRSKKTKTEMIDEALGILETNGASRVRTWGKMDVLLEVIDDTTAVGILHHLKRSSEFTYKFVYECLPKECRELSLDSFSNVAKESAYFAASCVPIFGSKMQGFAAKESVREVVEKGNQLIAARNNDQELTNEEVDELLKAVEPYGGTPLIQAMRNSVDLFRIQNLQIIRNFSSFSLMVSRVMETTHQSKSCLIWESPLCVVLLQTNSYLILVICTAF